MTWTTPRTWTNGEVETATIMNAHLRDNLSVIKVTRADSGKLLELSSTTLASLSPSGLTGLALRTAGSAYTAGKNRYLGTSRVVLPVGTDLYEDLGGSLKRGNWIEGTYLHHIASDQTTEYRYLGELVSTPAGARVGSVWVSGDYFYYIDASGGQRRCFSNASAPHSDAGAQGGSSWVETYLHWIRESGTLEKKGHYDVAHADGSAHGDVAHSDSHTDAHSDTAHVNTAHHDTAHTDVSHIDNPHIDQSGPQFHADVAHGDTAHSDVAHVDTAHVDTPHSDSHSDVAHGDVTHSDHTDHGDTAHQDQPTVTT